MLSALLPVATCILKNKALNKQLRVLFIYSIISVLTEAINLYLAKNNTYNYQVRNSFTYIECSLLLYIYFLQFSGQKVRAFILIAFCLFTLIAIKVLLIDGKINKSDNILTTFESSLFIVLSLYYLYSDIVENEIPRLGEKYFFWINNALLIFFGFSFFLFLFSGFLEKTETVIFKCFKGAYLLTNILFNILLSLGVWKTKTT